MLDSLLDPRVLLILNVGLYGAAFGGYLRLRRPSREVGPSEGFSFLEASLKRSFPDLPEGFTWREALDRLKRTDLRINWGEVTIALRQYEAWRYGESVQATRVSPEVTKLAKELSRRSHRWSKI